MNSKSLPRCLALYPLVFLWQNGTPAVEYRGAFDLALRCPDGHNSKFSYSWISSTRFYYIFFSPPDYCLSVVSFPLSLVSFFALGYGLPSPYIGKRLGNYVHR